MRSLIVGVALASLVSAQRGYGRYPCSTVNNDGSFSSNPAACTTANLAALPPLGTRAPPADAQCVQELETGGYFCGIAGAACVNAGNCDGGQCEDGKCQGGFTQACGQDDDNCSGFLSCLDRFSRPIALATCGGLDAFCWRPEALALAPDDYYEQRYFMNQFCSSGYCKAAGNDGNTLYICQPLGIDCYTDPDFACGLDATCDVANNVCVPNAVAPQPSGARARARRSSGVREKRGLCPAGYKACEVGGGEKGRECVDTSSNLEECGGCTSSTGVDCTSLPGVAAVGCVAGVCEVWACEEGWRWGPEEGVCRKV
ncbi:hypothetical protein JCM8547_002865 [Rhodosporidiobolus lusitaniae]